MFALAYHFSLFWKAKKLFLLFRT